MTFIEWLITQPHRKIVRDLAGDVKDCIRMKCLPATGSADDLLRHMQCGHGGACDGAYRAHQSAKRQYRSFLLARAAVPARASATSRPSSSLATSRCLRVRSVESLRQVNCNRCATSCW